ncbi:MAG: 50S ribosomal protein L11 methyltransferase [Bacteroidetes bacterium]|nr:50S ribosomal protein L11 methyltransferase [Bacteroidota bacterium]
MNKRKWYQFSLHIPSVYHDALIGFLASEGFTGFEQKESLLECFIPARKPKEKLLKTVTSILLKFQNEFPDATWKLTSKSIIEKNWNKIWEKNTGIVNATNTIVIKPHWAKLPKNDAKKLVIHIDPKMAFGTGHHETTRLSLLLLEKHLQKGASVLDFGCGTGILAIASIKLGAKSAVAIDNDQWAVSNAKENIHKNKVEHKVHVIQGSISKVPVRKFSLILANIDVPTIKKCLPALSRRMKIGGIAIVSGILVSDGDNLLPFFTQYRLHPIDMVYENEWIALALMKL